MQEKKLPEIKMNPVKSSAVEAAGFCPETNRIAIRYKGGRTYHSPGVSQETFDKLMSAESFGKHLNIIKSSFSFEKQ